jgi:hypothetical protein
VDSERRIEEIHNGHPLGRVICMVCGEDLAISGTPRVPEHSADAIRRFVRNHSKDHERST